jgi:oxygen-independent coproporphyrinogen-3 oxidase
MERAFADFSSERPFGLYVHIPYCLQICTYCDFVKFESKDLPPTAEYVSLLHQELETRSNMFERRALSSVYFGGGTPSLFAPNEILSVLQGIAKQGFILSSDAEVTLEINPGTISRETLKEFLNIGINRFSVGAQTFDEDLLKFTGRKHSVQETEESLELLANAGVNYSFDLLFGLPTQTLEGVRNDVRRALEFSPSHLSAYNLTVPAKHPLNKGRASDDVQAAMFETIEADLLEAGIFRYEVSNFARPGRESRHNSLYWSDAPYWGIGIGSHSYLPKEALTQTERERAPWGVRFWNPSTIAAYRKELSRFAQSETVEPFWQTLPPHAPERVEFLAAHESLTDFCHTSLRCQRGLSKQALEEKYGQRVATLVGDRLNSPELAAFVSAPKPDSEAARWVLTKQGQAMADRVFHAVTFLKEDGIE